MTTLSRQSFQESPRIAPRIVVIGVGGGGSNAVNRMVSAGLTGIDFIVANTDQQALSNSVAPVKIQLGRLLTKGLGSGSDPNVGRDAALEDTDKIIKVMTGADMVFVTTGLGGGTGTGAAPVIASLAKQLGALTIGVVTRPFKFEGRKRAAQAERGLAEMQKNVDTMLAIPNELLLSTVQKETTMSEAFLAADDVMRQAIQGISDIILVPGLVNLDFADVKTVMSRMGIAVMGTGFATGTERAKNAASAAVSNPLLGNARLDDARGVIINVTGGPNLTLPEVSEASNIIYNAAHEEANIIFGALVDPKMGDEIRITVIATGFEIDERDVSPPEVIAPAETEDADLGSVVVVWDPVEISVSDYSELVTALGDLVRSAGGIGIERIRSSGREIQVPGRVAV